MHLIPVHTHRMHQSRLSVSFSSFSFSFFLSPVNLLSITPFSGRMWRHLAPVRMPWCKPHFDCGTCVLPSVLPLDDLVITFLPRNATHVHYVQNKLSRSAILVSVCPFRLLKFILCLVQVCVCSSFQVKVVFVRHFKSEQCCRLSFSRPFVESSCVVIPSSSSCHPSFQFDLSKFVKKSLTCCVSNCWYLWLKCSLGLRGFAWCEVCVPQRLCSWVWLLPRRRSTKCMWPLPYRSGGTGRATRLCEHGHRAGRCAFLGTRCTCDGDGRTNRFPVHPDPDHWPPRGTNPITSGSMFGTRRGLARVDAVRSKLGPVHRYLGGGVGPDARLLTGERGLIVGDRWPFAHG